MCVVNLFKDEEISLRYAFFPACPSSFTSCPDYLLIIFDLLKCNMVKKLTIEDPATSVTDGRKLDECTYLRGDVKKWYFWLEGTTYCIGAEGSSAGQ